MNTKLTRDALDAIFNRHLQERLNNVKGKLEGTLAGENPDFAKEFSELESLTPLEMKQFEPIFIYMSLFISALLDTIYSNNQALSKAASDASP